MSENPHDIKLKYNQVFKLPWPFTYYEEGNEWHPGPSDATEPDEFCGEGFRVITFIMKFQPPGNFAPRICYTQTRIDPDGGIKTNGHLKTCTVTTFNKILKGCPYDYTIKC